MRILVTGRDGQLAKSLLERSRSCDHNLVAIGRPELDFTQPESIAAVVEATSPDLILNTAAYTAVDQAEDEPEVAHQINAEAAGELAAAARRAGARFIQISTDYVFDGAATAPYTEDAATNPLGAYGRSKLAGEEAVRSSNPDHLIVRTSWVYSSYGRNFVKTMAGVAARGGTARVVADQYGTPSAAADLAEGLLRIVSEWKSGTRRGLGEIYHLGGTGVASWFEVAECIFEAFGRRHLSTARAEPIVTADWPTAAVRPAYSALDSRKFERDFRYRMPNWQASVDAVVGRLAQAVSA